MRGMLTAFLTWRWSLLVNVPVGAVVVITVGRLIAQTHPKSARLDIVGALSATLGSVALVYGFIRTAESFWASAVTLMSFVAAVGLFVIFVWTEKTLKASLLHLDLSTSSGGKIKYYEAFIDGLTSFP